MTAFALGLVLSSAVMHATWNLLAKRIRAETPFLFLIYVVGAIAYTPFAIALLVISRPEIGWIALAFVAMAIVLQTVYFATLTAGYRAGDLSLVYPIARSTGPLLATVGAIAILGERPSPVAIAGALAIVVGAFILTGDPRSLRRRGALRAVAFALATGVVIALYTLWDKTAVSLLLIPPLIYDWMVITGQAAVVAPFARRRWTEVREVWRTQRRTVLAVGVLSRLSYLLMLTALVISPVSYVAPARETGILFGTLLGARVLAEGDLSRRALGASAMVVGIVLLALG
ncbi:MAG TPA: EamA family transporter [Candidatus Limnocylindrales bacterium]|nr:EamA family transporter [Candidatus Limnocylindrales bacterium]